jgi:CRP-like cAMP-binding protein
VQKVLYILGELREEDIDRLARAGTTENVEAGAVLIREAKPIDAVFFVLDGHLEVTSTQGGPIATLGVGEVVGELSMIDKASPSATVTGGAAGALVLRIGREELSRRLDDEAQFAARFYRALAIFLSTRLRATMGRLGYGSSCGDSVDEIVDLHAGDEPDDTLTATAHVARERFRRLLARLRDRANG